MKKYLLKLINYYYEYKVRSNAIVGKNLTTSRFAKIKLIDGAKKENIIIGNNVMLNCELVASGPGIIIIEDYASLRVGTVVGSVNSIKIRKGAVISNDVKIYDNNNHPVNSNERCAMVISGWGSDEWKWIKSASKAIDIGENVWVGQYSRICKGVVIGNNSIVAASTVVTKSIPSNVIVAGNPGKIVKKIL